MDFWIELSIYYTELSLVWKLIACGTGLLAAGAAAYILKQRETETVFGRPAKGRIAAVGLLVMYMMLVLASLRLSAAGGSGLDKRQEERGSSF